MVCFANGCSAIVATRQGAIGAKLRLQIIEALMQHQAT